MFIKIVYRCHSCSREHTPDDVFDTDGACPNCDGMTESDVVGMTTEEVEEVRMHGKTI